MSAAPGGPRPRRWRRRLLWLAASLTVLLLVLLVAVLWLLHSERGRDLALARVAPLAGLSWDGAEGTLAGPLLLHDARLAFGDTEVHARRLRLDLAPAALWSRRVAIESLQAAGVTVLLPATDETAPASGPLPELLLPEVDLPVSVQLDAVELRGLVLRRRGVPEPLLRLSRLALSGSVSRAGTVVLTRLRADSGHGRLEGSARVALDGARDLDARLALRGPAAGAPPAELVLAGSGATLAATLALPGDDRLQLALDGARWRLDSALTAVDPSPWWPDWQQGPLSLVLQAQGEGSRGRLAPGRVALGETALAIGASGLALDAEAQTLALAPLVLGPLAADGAPAGTATVQGTVSLDGGSSELALSLDALALPGAGSGLLSGSGHVSGTPTAWQVRFDGTLLHPDATLPLTLAGHGDDAALVLEQFRVGGGRGESLAGSGRVQWAPALAVTLDGQLDGFDPARFHGDWPGALSGHVRLQASEQVDGWQATLKLEALRGRLRGRPLRGEGTLHWGLEAARTELALAVGDSRLTLAGSAGAALDLRLGLSPLHLSDLLPDAAGTVQGSVRVTGTRDAPQLAVQLDARALALAGQQARRLRIDGRFAPDFSRPADLSVQGSGLLLGGVAFDSADATLRGTRADHRLEADLAGDTALALELEGALDADRGWRGTLQALRLQLPGQPPWALRAPAALAFADGGFGLAPACLAGPVMTLCAEAHGDAGVQQAAVTLEALPLAALAPLLARDEPIPLVLAGQVSGEAHLARRGDTLEIHASLALPAGSAALATAETRELLAWRDLSLQADTEGTQLRLRAEGVLEDSGRLALDLAGEQPWRGQAAAVSGTLALELPRLRVLELLTPHVADPDGRLDAALAISGSWAAPRLDGEVVVAELRTELPALGIRLRESRLVARPRADGTLALSGNLDTGAGALAVQGRIARGQDGLVATAELDGERVLASDTPLLRALVSPDLSLRYTAAQGLAIEGRVAIPEARLDLDRLEGSVSPSPDVVVLDPREPAGGEGALPVVAEVTLVLGQDVELEGMGFDGSVRGSLAVSERPGRVTNGRGTLEVTGEYTAYGQDLKVVHGRLLYSATPLDNPSLDVRAIREVREQTVGLNIRGSARQPALEIFAEPPLEQAEALSYLVLGRPLTAATSAEGGQLSQAAAAIGGNFLAERLGARLGFDTFEVGDSEGLGTTAFTVGKYLSPRLYVSYGMALFEEGRLLTLRYILSRRFELEFESGAENRVGVNYTLER